MSHESEVKADRRQFLVGGAAATAGVASLNAVADAAPRDAAAFAASASVVLHDPQLSMPADIAARLSANGARVIALDEDPVRMWRSEIGAVLADPSTRLLGITRWADLLIVKGLAAETRRHVRFEKLDADSGTFTWLIA
jgi:hypothetical protein